MADTAVARREARRKKILENSSNRLQLISGKNNDECLKGSVRPSILEDIQEVSRCESPVIAVNGSAVMETFQSCFVSTPFSTDVEDTEIVNCYTHAVSKSDSIQHTFWQKFLNNKYDVVLMSLFLQVLCSFFSLSFADGYFFLPFILYIATKTMFIRMQQESQLANILLLLNGIAPQKVQRVIFIAQLFGVFVQDMCIFLFSTICTQSLFITLKEVLVT